MAIEKTVTGTTTKAAEATQSMTAAAANIGQALVDGAAKHFQQSEETLRKGAGVAEQKVRESLGVAKERGKLAGETASSFISRHPMATVGLALGAIALLSILRRSAQHNPTRH